MKLNAQNIIIIVLFSMAVQLQPGCSGCSKSGIKRNQTIYENKPDKTVIKMKKVGGVYEIPVVVNGESLFFIFDTGASTIAISETEASVLYQKGKLSEDDIVGKANFIDANGDISEGTIIILRTVKIGGRVLKDVRASVTHNLNAPLLFGQSALEKFVRVSIDYKKDEIIFE